MPPKFKSDFAPEWLALAALAALNLLWGQVIGFHLTAGWGDGKLIGCGIAAMLLLRWLWPRGVMMAEYFSLTAAATMVFGVLSYLSLASSRAMADAPLLAADRALGFDWLAGYHFLLAHPLLASVLGFAYGSMVYQALYFCVLFSLMDKKQQLREMFWLVLVMGLLTSAGVLLFPALGPYNTFHAGPPDNFVPVMKHLKSGKDLSFALGQMTGVVSFPSFHTAMALAYIWGFRRTGPIGWAITALNLVMLCAIPYFGGHYLVDMIAGAGVMLLSLAATRLWFGRLAGARDNAVRVEKPAYAERGACQSL
ncbi:MAG TPA: phosphatase PAP2 family protein [Rhizomicrobium sp.]|nr:phosphatase PAP2 family protein [Rhizomicrobium sp.]